MSNKQKIAAEFVGLHKDSDINHWQPLNESNDVKKLNSIFINLISGVYGECRGLNGGYDESNNYVVPTRWEIEIGRYESASGSPILFQFEYSKG